ncbi:MAG: hypothetical protein ACO35C_08105, partial [Pontimonas sp.]
MTDKWTIGWPQDHTPIEVEFKKLMEDRAPYLSTGSDCEATLLPEVPNFQPTYPVWSLRRFDGDEDISNWASGGASRAADHQDATITVPLTAPPTVTEPPPASQPPSAGCAPNMPCWSRPDRPAVTRTLWQRT